MLHSLSKRIAFFVCEKTDLLPLEIYVYGFELIISSIIETSALLLVGFLIGKIIETMLFLFSFSSIRFFSGGYHANSYLKCFAVTLVNYFLVLFLYNNLIDFSVNIILVFSLVTFILSLILFIKVCPVKSKGKTILNYKMQKRLSVIALCINMALVMVLFYILKNSILIKEKQNELFFAGGIDYDCIMKSTSVFYYRTKRYYRHYFFGIIYQSKYI